MGLIEDLRRKQQLEEKLKQENSLKRAEEEKSLREQIANDRKVSTYYYYASPIREIFDVLKREVKGSTHAYLNNEEFSSDSYLEYDGLLNGLSHSTHMIGIKPSWLHARLGHYYHEERKLPILTYPSGEYYRTDFSKYVPDFLDIDLEWDVHSNAAFAERHRESNTTFKAIGARVCPDGKLIVVGDLIETVPDVLAPNSRRLIEQAVERAYEKPFKHVGISSASDNFHDGSQDHNTYHGVH